MDHGSGCHPGNQRSKIRRLLVAHRWVPEQNLRADLDKVGTTRHRGTSRPWYAVFKAANRACKGNGKNPADCSGVKSRYNQAHPKFPLKAAVHHGEHGLVSSRKGSGGEGSRSSGAFLRPWLCARNRPPSRRPGGRGEHFLSRSPHQRVIGATGTELHPGCLESAVQPGSAAVQITAARAS